MLPDQQTAFAAALLHGARSAEPAAGVSAAVLAIHRNNIFASLVTVLGAAYPALARDLGERDFRRLATRFVRAHPPRRPQLWMYGRDMAAFLATVEDPTRVHLPELARLEWAMHAAYFAADVSALEPASLAAAPSAEVDRLRLETHPSVHLVGTRLPVLGIREALLKGAPLPAATPVHDHHVLVWRSGASVAAESLGAGAFTLALALSMSRPLGEAAAAATRTKIGFDLQSELGALIAHRIFTAFSFADHTEEESI